MTDRTRIQEGASDTRSRASFAVSRSWIGPAPIVERERASVELTRRVRIPDLVRLERFRRSPEIGPRLLCFGGHSLSEPFGARLVQHTHNAIHILHPGRSDGPAIRLSEAFRMPAVGTLVRRLLELADPWSSSVDEIREFLEFRFPADRSGPRLRSWLRRMSRGANGPIETLPGEMSILVRDYIESFVQGMPATFDLRGVGMLEILMAGGYLRHGGQLDPVVYLFSRLLGIRGRVRPVVMDDLILLAELVDGSLIPITPGDPRWEREASGERIRKLRASRRRRGGEEGRLVDVALDPQTEELIRAADVLCYPPGKFFSGLLATLFHSGIGKTIADCRAPKVWVPDTDASGEGAGVPLSDRLILLLAHVQRGERELDRGALLDCVLVDPGVPWVDEVEMRKIEEMGFEVVRMPLSEAGSDRLDGSRLAEALLSLG